MTNKATYTPLDSDDKGALYWKHLIYRHAMLMATYLSQMQDIKCLEDLERQEADELNLVRILSNPDSRRFFSLGWLEKRWVRREALQQAIDTTNQLVNELDARPATDEAFIRMATVRTVTHEHTQTEYNFFVTTLIYAFAPPWPSPDELLICLAEWYEQTARRDWEIGAKFYLEAERVQMQEDDKSTTKS